MFIAVIVNDYAEKEPLELMLLETASVMTTNTGVDWFSCIHCGSYIFLVPQLRIAFAKRS